MNLIVFPAFHRVLPRSDDTESPADVPFNVRLLARDRFYLTRDDVNHEIAVFLSGLPLYYHPPFLHTSNTNHHTTDFILLAFSRDFITCTGVCTHVALPSCFAENVRSLSGPAAIASLCRRPIVAACSLWCSPPSTRISLTDRERFLYSDECSRIPRFVVSLSLSLSLSRSSSFSVLGYNTKVTLFLSLSASASSRHYHAGRCHRNISTAYGTFLVLASQPDNWTINTTGREPGTVASHHTRSSCLVPSDTPYICPWDARSRSRRGLSWIPVSVDHGAPNSFRGTPSRSLPL